MKYILEYHNFSNNKPIIEIINPTPDTKIVYTPVLDIEANITGAVQTFGLLNKKWLDWSSFKFDGKKFTTQLTLKEGDNFIEIGAKSDKNVSSWYKMNITYTSQNPKINIITPSNEEIVFNSTISLEAEIENGTKVSVYKNGTTMNPRFYEFKEGNLFIEKIFLDKGDNTVKIVASNNSGKKTESIIKVTYQEHADTSYTAEENKVVMDKIRELVRKYWGNVVLKNQIVYKNDTPIDTEYLSKWSNNRNFRSKLSYRFNIEKNPTALIEFIEENQKDIFDFDGQYFNWSYEILRAATLAGKRNEKIALQTFKKYQESLGKNIVLEEPTPEQDKYEHIDQFAIIDGERFTIQVKPIDRILSKGDFYEILSKGDVRKVTTDFLILANKTNCFIIRVPLEEFSPGYKKDLSKVDSIKTQNFEIRDRDKMVSFSKDLLLFEK